MTLDLRRLVTAVAAALLAVGTAVPAAVAASDPYRASQWGLELVEAPSAWGVSQGGGEVIAIVDSGVDLEHPDLVDRLLRDDAGRIVGRDYVDGDRVPQDANGHGTMVAGIAAATADNGVGIAGVAPAAAIMPLRVLDERGRGRAADVDAAIRWAVDHGATVVNLSLESVLPLPGQIISQAPTAAVRYAWDRGVVVVAAAGNSGSAFTDYPASSPVLIVGATDRGDRRASFSDGGRRDAVMAPGVEIVSTWCDPSPAGCDPDNRYGQADGTSFAAPSVAGAIAVLRASGRSAEEAVERLRATAVDLGPEGPDADHGFGRIDVSAAVAGARVGTDTGTAAEDEPPAPGTSSPTRTPAPADRGQPAATATPPPTPDAGVGTDPTASTASPAPDGAPTQPPDGAVTVPPPGADDVTPLVTPPPDGADVRAGGEPAGDEARRDALLRLAAALVVAAAATTWTAAWRWTAGAT